MKSIMRYVTNKNHKYDQKYILRKKGEERGRNYKYFDIRFKNRNRGQSYTFVRGILRNSVAHDLLVG